MKSNRDDDSFAKQFAMFGITLGYILSYVGVGFALGYYLWEKQGVPWPIFPVTLGLGLYGAIRQILRATRKTEEK